MINIVMWGNKRGLKFVVLVLLFGGVYSFIRFVSNGITGSVVGNTSTSPNLLWTVGFFMLALAVTHFFIKD